jgi:hypothetical protein
LVMPSMLPAYEEYSLSTDVTSLLLKFVTTCSCGESRTENLPRNMMEAELSATSTDAVLAVQAGFKCGHDGVENC